MYENEKREYKSRSFIFFICISIIIVVNTYHKYGECMIDPFFVHELLMITRKRTTYMHTYVYVCMYILLHTPYIQLKPILSSIILRTYLSNQPTNQRVFKKKRKKKEKERKEEKKEIPKPARGIAGIGPCLVIGPSNYVCVCHSVLELHMYVMYVCMRGKAR